MHEITCAVQVTFEIPHKNFCEYRYMHCPHFAYLFHVAGYRCELFGKDKANKMRLSECLEAEREWTEMTGEDA